MKLLKVLSILIVLLISFTVACTPKTNPEEEVIKNYYNFLAQNKWDEAYDLLSAPSKEKFSLEEFKNWAELADSVREPKSSTVLKTVKINDYGDNLDLPNFNEVKVATAEVLASNKINPDSSTSQDLVEKVNLVVVDEKNKWKIYLQELEKASYYKELGKKHQAEENYSEAITYYRKALQEDEEDIWSKYHLAENLNHLGEVEEALALMEEVINQKERIYGFSPVDELKNDLILSYSFMIKLLETQGESSKIDKYEQKLEKLKP